MHLCEGCERTAVLAPRGDRHIRIPGKNGVPEILVLHDIVWIFECPPVKSMEPADRPYITGYKLVRKAAMQRNEDETCGLCDAIFGQSKYFNRSTRVLYIDVDDHPDALRGYDPSTIHENVGVVSRPGSYGS
jgi:hypothetical protein